MALRQESERKQITTTRLHENIAALKAQMRELEDIQLKLQQTPDQQISQTDSCNRLLVALVKVSADTPMMTSVTPNIHATGVNIAKTKPPPNRPAPSHNSPKCGRSRPAASSAPSTVPTAMVPVSAPY